MADEISRDFASRFTYYNDCSAAFGQELQSHSRAGLPTNLCNKPALESYADRNAYHNAEREKIDLQVRETGAIEIEPFIAVGMGHSDVEPARIGIKGLLEEVVDKRFESGLQNSPVTFHEKAESEGHLGLIIKY